jgi:hypothetical protein
MTAPLRAAAVATALVGALALPAAVEAGHGRSPRSYFRGRGYVRSYRPAIVVAPYYRYYPSPVYDPYYYAPAPYYDPYDAPYGYGYSSYRYSPYRRGYSYGYRHFHGGVACYLPHVRIGIGW